MKVGKWLVKLWNSYKYRFVPWISLNVKFKERPNPLSSDGNIEYKEGNRDIIKQQVEIDYVEKVHDCLITNDELRTHLEAFFSKLSYSKKPNYSSMDIYRKNCDIFYAHFGFLLERKKSAVSSEAGAGVFVVAGTVRAGSLVALYPGTIYMPYEPLFFPSLGNSFIFRCSDGVHVDGNDRWISKSIYKSCASRDQFDFDVPCCDTSWLSPIPINTLNIGQYVNNQSKRQKNNVVYQECKLFVTDTKSWRPTYVKEDECIAVKFAKFLPNVWSNPENNRKFSLRVIPLIAVEDISENSELLSSYFTVIHT